MSIEDFDRRVSQLRTDWLLGFEAFARHRSFTAAARELHLSQPALHAQIGRLSETLGVTLYRREGRRLWLTAEGERVLVFARESLARSRTLVQQLRGGVVEEPLVLAAGEGAFLYLLGEGIRRYRQANERPLRLLTLDRDGCLEAVRDGRAQLGVAVVARAPRGLEAEVLAEVPLAVALPVDHPLAEEPTLRAGQLDGQTLVVPPPEGASRPRLELLLEGVDWKPAVEARGWPLTLHFVGLGLGLAVVNACVRPPEGVLLRPLSGAPAVRYAMLWRRGARGAPGLRAALLGP